MAMDAGTIYLSAPANGQATEAALAGAVSAGDKAFFLATEGMDIVEVGAVCQTTTTVTPLAFTVATAPKLGGSYTVQATVTAPGAMTAGNVLKKQNIKIHLDRGMVVRFSVTAAPTAGAAMLYAKGYPAGTGVAGELASTT